MIGKIRLGGGGMGCWCWGEMGGGGLGGKWREDESGKREKKNEVEKGRGVGGG